MKARKYIVVPDFKVVTLWKSVELDESAEINPDWFQENGTPQDTEGVDMDYIETRILVDD